MKVHFAILLTVALLQVATSQTVNDLSAEYKPIIEQRQTNLGLNIGLNGQLIGQTFGALGTNIDIAFSNFTNDLVDLDNLVNLSVAEGQAANTNIDACVAALGTSVSALNPREIQTCRSIPQLGQAKLKLNELGLLQRDLGNILPTCLVLSPLDVVQIRSCLDGELVLNDNKITVINNELQSLLNLSLTVGNDCVNTKRSQWENQLSVIENDFRTCIGEN